jgi:hypothetical protein
MCGNGCAASYSASIPLFLAWRRHNDMLQSIAAYFWRHDRRDDDTQVIDAK